MENINVALSIKQVNFYCLDGSFGKNSDSSFVDVLSGLIHKHYLGRPVIYISDRVNSYSLDPVARMDLIERNNIRFAGVMTYTAMQKRILLF